MNDDFRSLNIIRGHNFIFVYILLVISFTTWSQEAQQGMIARPNNYTSFGSNEFEHPGELNYLAPCEDCYEDISARTEFTKFYLGTGKNSGKVYSQKGYSPINIRNNSGQWITFDNRMRIKSPGVYHAPDQHSPTEINTSQKFAQISNPVGTLKFNYNLELIWLHNGIETSLGFADYSAHTAGDDGVYVKDAWPGIDMEMNAQIAAIKTNFILKNRPLHTHGTYIIRDHFELSEGLSITEDDGKLRIVSGEIHVFDISEVVGYDNVLDRDNRNLTLFQYVLKGTQVDIVLPLEFLVSPMLQYPYTIDPLVTTSNTLAQASITGSGYGSQCFSNFCSYTLSVPVPLNAQITNVLSTFNYIAQTANYCYRSEGAVRYKVGSCLSPNQAGYFWYCNNPSPGTCNGTNISLFPELGSCLPAPTCTPTNLSIDLQFFRCYLSGGCSNTCIGAASPWTITLEAQTLNYSNVSNPITLSNTTVCQGQSVQASTTANFGVQPYTYNWSFNASGSPSVGSGSSVNIPMNTAGTVTLYSFVTDACNNTVSSSAVINVTSAPTVNFAPNPVSICSGSSTGISLTSTPAGATFSWTATPSGVLGASSGSGATINQTLAATGGAGTVTYAVTASMNGCVSTPSNILVTVTSPSTLSTATNPITICSGDVANIVVTSNPAGVNAGYGATGTNTTGYSSGTGLNVSHTLTTVDPNLDGTVTYNFIGGSGSCLSNPLNVTVNVLANPDAGFTYPTSSFCQGGSNVLPIMNTPGLQGTFSDGGSGIVNGTTGELNIASGSVGTYTITFTPSNSCSSPQTQTITIVAAPIAGFAYASSTFCASMGTEPVVLQNGASSGVFTSTPTGLTIDSGTGEVDLANSSAGIYTITNSISAQNGCPAVNATTTIEIISPPTATLSGGGTYCSSEVPPSMNIQLTGASPWQVVISDGSTNTTLTITTSTYQYNPTGPGTYSLVSVMSGDCVGQVFGSATASIVYEPVMEQPLDVVACAGSTVNIAPFVSSNSGVVFSWFNANTTIGLSNAGGSGNIPSFTAVNNGSSPVVGTINVTPSVNNCTGTTTSFTITIVPVPTPSVATNTSYCMSGPLDPITGTASAGGSLTWYSDAGMTSIVGTGGNFTPPLVQGTSTYYLVEYVNGCNSNPVAFTVTIHPNPIVYAGADFTTCSANPITLSGQGANSYQWSGGVVNGQPFTQPVGVVTYTVTGTDGNNCTGTDQITITTVPSPTPTILSQQNVLCNGDANGSVSVGVTGGVVPYNYAWSNGGSVTGDLVNLSAGTYHLVVTDNSGCTGNLSVIITQPNTLTATANVNHYNCLINKGKIEMIPTGGTAPYLYNWSPNVSNSAIASNLDVGEYMVTVVDINNCTFVYNTTINDSTPPIYYFDPSSGVIDYGDSLQVSIVTMNGTQMDSIVWIPSSHVSCFNCYDPLLSPRETTWFYATIYTSNGCSYIDSILVEVIHPCAEVFVPSIFSPNGDGMNDMQCVRGTCIAAMEFIIFDRWGEIVFKTTDQNNCWDGTFRGKKVQSGVYVYRLTGRMKDGKDLQMSGSITVAH